MPLNTGTFTVRLGDAEHRVALAADAVARVDGGETAFAVIADSPSVYRVDDGTRARRVYVVATGDRRQVFVEGEVYEFETCPGATVRRTSARTTPDVLSAPMPAKVIAVLVRIGHAVHRGDIVVKLEAMKMELPVRAPRDGTVRSIACREGEIVQPGVPLLELS